MQRIQTLLASLCGCLAATAAGAAQQPTFAPLAVATSSAQKAEAHAAKPLLGLPPPQFSETRVVRAADGSTQIVCHDVANPDYAKQLRQLQQQEGE